MARQVLENGVILPAEYSDDWYDDMTSNLTKLDDVIGSDSEKLSSSDVGAAALSNNYNDLDNLPTIPTVNDATLTIQKNGVDVQTFTANASSNVTCNITVPTKTSDLTNDSNFVDTSNSAVSSGITSAKVTDYDTHIADTDIHVTTADKNRWNNQTYVFRYSSTALTASSTNSNALLDNTDNLKVGDKVIDSSGVLFSITAIDTQNSTFTIGTALIDLAQDSDVVHKSGNETIAGEKTFSNFISSDGSYLGNESNSNERTNLCLRANRDTTGQSGAYIGRFRQNRAQGDMSGSDVSFVGLDFLENSTRYTRCFTMGLTDWDSNGVPQTYYITAPNDKGSLGTSYQQWNKVYANEYYYGSTNTEFSSKFVTTDTAQTITSNKTFVGSQYFKDNNIQYFGIDFSKGTAPSAYTARCTYFSPLTGGGSSYQTSNGLVGCAVSNDNVVTTFMHAIKNTAGTTTRTSFILYYDTNNDKRSVATNGNFLPILTGQGIGDSTTKWSTINGLNPSSLGMPDLSNGIDISSYITIGDTDNNYTPPANGWIWIRLIGNGASIIQGDFGSNASYVTNNLTSEKWVETNLFVTKDVQATIRCRDITGIVMAKFYPCLGNV